jgi:transcriptional regulator with XRE-family HTH domain
VPKRRSLDTPQTAAWLKAVGRRIRAKRIEVGLTQECLAELADITPRTLQKLEAGEFATLISTLKRVRAGLGCRYDDLLPD